MPVTMFLHQVHRVRGLAEDEFDVHLRDWMAALAAGDDARLVWVFHQAHGSGPSYRVVTITAVQDAAAYGRLAERVSEGDLRSWARRLDELQHDSTGKLLTPLAWSPRRRLDLASVPTDPDAEAEIELYMEDTGWPHAPLDDYTAFWERVYLPLLQRAGGDTRPKLLEIDAVFQVAYGAGRRPEAILLQRIVDHAGLLQLLERETPKELRQPGAFMHDALQLRDQWESRLLRTVPWSPSSRLDGIDQTP